MSDQEYTSEDLSKHNGSDPSLTILVAVKGNVYDVSSGKDFYGPGSPYAVFAGKDASKGLAKMSTKPEDLTSPEELSAKERGVLDDWEKKFQAKYKKVGTLSS